MSDVRHLTRFASPEGHVACVLALQDMDMSGFQGMPGGMDMSQMMGGMGGMGGGWRRCLCAVSCRVVSKT